MNKTTTTTQKLNTTLNQTFILHKNQSNIQKRIEEKEIEEKPSIEPLRTTGRVILPKKNLILFPILILIVIIYLKLKKIVFLNLLKT